MQHKQGPKGYKCSTQIVTTPQIQRVHRTPNTKWMPNKFTAIHSSDTLQLISNPSQRILAKLVEGFQRRRLQTTTTKQQAPQLFLLGQN
jgi:hypothetical protein